MQVTIDGVPFVPACASASRIGIAITTHNRPDVLKRAIEQHMKYLPAGALVVVSVCGDHIVLSKLIHGVCYSPPQGRMARILSAWNKTLAADYAVGEAFGGRVIYPCYSLVDHADMPAVERHPDNEPRTERRRAWRLA